MQACRLESHWEGAADDTWTEDREMLPPGNVTSGRVNTGPVNEGADTEGAVNDGSVKAGADTVVKDGSVNERPVNEGPVKEGPVNEGSVKDGPVNEGPVNEGSVNEGSVNEGPVNEGSENEGPVKLGPLKSPLMLPLMPPLKLGRLKLKLGSTMTLLAAGRVKLDTEPESPPEILVTVSSMKVSASVSVNSDTVAPGVSASQYSSRGSWGTAPLQIRRKLATSCPMVEMTGNRVVHAVQMATFRSDVSILGHTHRLRSSGRHDPTFLMMLWQLCLQ